MADPARKYRADIDGLRAVAIIPVVLFHLKIRRMTGGFVGVDIFFVISGYLITLHIFSELEAGKFSLKSFYERRIRRIFPALIAMFAGSTILACLCLFPNELIDFAKSLIAAVFSVSNFYFWTHSGYFSTGDEPLLHTWSLAVEEQFYLTLPLTLMLLHRYCARYLRTVVTAVALVSLALSAYTVSRYPNATFYLLPARCWELLIGSMLALKIVRCPSNTMVRQVCGLVGAAMVLVAILKFDPGIPFPGPAALVPCVGAALIIASGGEGPTLVSRVLSTRPLVGIGLISYSLYLWHYLVIYFLKVSTSIVFGRVFRKLMPFLPESHAVNLEMQSLAIVLSVTCAFLSWKFVERPFRTGPGKPSRAMIFRLAAVSSVLLFAVGLGILGLQGIPERFSPRAIRIASYALSTNPSHYRQGTCFITPSDPPYDRKDCLRLSGEKQNWLLMGDSHAAHLYYGLSSTFRGVNLMQVTASGCKPLSDKRRGELKECTSLFGYMYGDFLGKHHVSRVILAANWDSDDVNRLGKSIQQLKEFGDSVVVIGPIMHYDAALPRLLAASVESGNQSVIENHRVRSYDALDAEMERRALTSWHVPYFSYEDAFCKGEQCLAWSAPDVPLQWDHDHLLDSGSVLVARQIEQEKILSTDPVPYGK